jgi:hypothetical protein
VFLNCQMTTIAASAYVVSLAGGTFSRVRFDGGSYSGWSALVHGAGSGTGPTVVFANGATIVAGSRVVNFNAMTSGLVIIESLIIVALASGAFYTSGGSYRVVGGNLSPPGSFTLAQRAAAESIGVNGATLPSDVSVLTPAAGDQANNTNAATAPFATGPSIYDGTRWKLLSTGATHTGTATLAAGTVTVADASITANSVIRLAQKTAGGTPGALFISAKVATTSFTITSTNASDTSIVQYDVIAY